MKEKIKGVFIPIEFYELGLSDKEMMILAIYKYYTEEGELKCSVYTNQKIADIIKANVKTVIRAKKRFKELGYIRTDGGIRTYYLGINKGHDVRGGMDTMYTVGMDTVSGGVCTQCPGGMDTMYTVGMDTVSPHNKEEKRIKKENNKEIIKNKKRVNKEEMKSELKEKQTVFERVIPYMNQVTKEQIDYISEKCKEQIDKINKAEEYGEITVSKLKEYARGFRDTLSQNGKIIYNKKVLPKEKEKDVSYIDLF